MSCQKNDCIDHKFSLQKQPIVKFDTLSSGYNNHDSEMYKVTYFHMRMRQVEWMARGIANSELSSDFQPLVRTGFFKLQLQW